MEQSSRAAVKFAGEAGGAPAPRSSGLLIGTVFLSVTAWFVWGPDLVEVPLAPPASIDEAMISAAPVRSVLHDLSTIHLEGFDRACTDCHRTLEGEVQRIEGQLQHPHIEVRHADLEGCYGCHDRANPGRLGIGSRTVPFSRARLLCARCHRSVGHDWEKGMHGRTEGYWDAGQGLVRRLECSECHDPHAPRTPVMDPVAPLPGPNTLRMGEPTPHSAHDAAPTDPLRRALQADTGR